MRLSITKNNVNDKASDEKVRRFILRMDKKRTQNTVDFVQWGKLHMKKAFIGMAMLLCLCLYTGCGTQTDHDADRTESEETEEQETEKEETEKETAEEPEENAQEEEKKEEKEEKGTETLQILTGSYYDYSYSEELQQGLASLRYPMAKLGNEDKKEYPGLAEALAHFSEEKQKSVMEGYQTLVEDAKSLADDPNVYLPFETTEKLYVRRADTHAVSLLNEGYYYGGGAHGFSYFETANFDTETGKALELTDVVTDVNAIPELLTAQIEKFEDMDQLYADIGEIFDTEYETLKWTLDYHGITFYFEPYQLASYAYGPVIATITFAEHPELFSPAYMEVPESYSIEFSDAEPLYYDLDHDGEVDRLVASGVWSDAYMYEQQSISVNDTVHTEEIYGFEMEPVLIHAADGNNYLYVQNASENDHRSLAVYRILPDAVELADVLDCGWNVDYEEEGSLILKYVLTDPQEFSLENRTDVLSTVTGLKQYSMGADGVPVSEQTAYLLEDERYLTLLQPLDAEVIDEQTGEKIEDIRLETGTEVLYYRTDNETFADLRLEDERVVRVFVDNTDWPILIHGTPIEEIFDGVMFAG